MRLNFLLSCFSIGQESLSHVFVTNDPVLKLTATNRTQRKIPIVISQKARALLRVLSLIQLRLTAVSLDLEPAQNSAQTRGFSTLLIPNRDPESIYSLDCTGSLL